VNLNTTPCPPEPQRRPSLRDLAALTTTLLPPALVMLAPLPELARRCQEINLTHPEYCEETPLVLSYESTRRQRLSGQLRIVHRAPQPQPVAYAASL
jgi:hypothetical protein